MACSNGLAGHVHTLMHAAASGCPSQVAVQAGLGGAGPSAVHQVSVVASHLCLEQRLR